MFFLHILILYHLLEEVIFTLYYLYTTTNKNISGDFSSYWMQSSLKISPVEQVELLKNLYRNNFNFTPANIHAVKNSIHLTASENGEFMEKPEPDE